MLPLLCLVLPLALASPIDVLFQTHRHNKRSSFTIHQSPQGYYLRNGPAQVAKASAKYGHGRVPENILAAAQAAAVRIAECGEAKKNGSVPAVPQDEYDVWYLAPATLGNDVVQLNFDTGSADLWAWSTLMPHEMLEGREDYYHVEPSKELKNHAWRIRYGDGSYAKGKVYMDKVVVGGVTATTQAVEAATLVSTQFEQDELTDGLLGLAFSHLNSVEPNPQKTFFDNVMADLQEPVFAVNLKNRAPGSYDFGFVDEGKYTGDIAYIDVNSTDGFWTIYPEGYAVGGSSTVLRTFETITDTGTTLTFVPTEVAKAYYAQVKGSWYSGDQAGWIAPCNAALPDFSLVISGVKRTMPGKYARFAPLEDGSSNCFGGIQGAGGNIPSILGDTFLKSQYVIHEIRDGKARMGFAQQAGLQNVMGT